MELRNDRSVAAGTTEELCNALRRGADLRVYTEWLHEEHVAPDLPEAHAKDAGLLQEVIDFRETMLVDDRYAAGVTTLRQSMLPIIGFNPTAPPRMSFFLYGMDGQQACSHMLLDSTTPGAAPGNHSTHPRRADMPKMGEEGRFDEGTPAPSRNFIYDFERYRFFVRDDWTLVLAHDAQGQVVSGSFHALHDAHLSGREIKAAISGLNDDLGNPLPHEVITLLGSGWVHVAQHRYEVMTHPIVRIAPAIPLRYASQNWDITWVFLRSDGAAVVRRLDPYTRTFADHPRRLAVRWFAR